jgi:branched-chain amino acid aminotransferase
MKKYCYHNERITSIDKIKISPYDLGLLRGYAVFDVMCTENGKPFLPDEHWKRLKNSAKELGLKIPIRKEKFELIVKKLLKINGFPKSTIRTFLSGGISRDGSTPEGKENLFILIEPFHKLKKEIYKKGIKLITVEFTRFFPKAKTANYICALKNHSEKVRQKAFEILFVKNGAVFEASTSNFFIVKGEKIITPKEEILHGITRDLLLKLAAAEKMPVEERDILLDEVFSADEAFITATNKKVVPVVKIDNKIIGKGKVGEIAKRLMKILEDFAEQY